MPRHVSKSTAPAVCPGGPDRLNARQRRFVEEYLIDLNAEQAARRAGYAEASAQKNGLRLLEHPDVRAALDAAVEARARHEGIVRDQVIAELAAIAFMDPIEIATTALRGPADIALLPERARRLIAGWGFDARGRFQVKLHAKLPALEALARHLGLFIERKRVDLRACLAPETEPPSETARWLEEVLGDGEEKK
ncbi:MAG: terminase small subunit [Rhodospirillales bacterium]